MPQIAYPPTSAVVTANLTVPAAVPVAVGGNSAICLRLSGATFSVTGGLQASFDGGTTYPMPIGFQPQDGGPLQSTISGFTQAAVSAYPAMVAAIPAGATHVRFNATVVTGTLTVGLGVGPGPGTVTTEAPFGRHFMSSITSNVPFGAVASAWERPYVTYFSAGGNGAAGNTYVNPAVAGQSYTVITYSPGGSAVGVHNGQLVFNPTVPLAGPLGGAAAQPGTWLGSIWGNVTGFRSL
jgi:hypothetical protein